MNRLKRGNSNSTTTPNSAALRKTNCRVSTPNRAMRKIQTPIKSSIGNHEVRNETSEPPPRTGRSRAAVGAQAWPFMKWLMLAAALQFNSASPASSYADKAFRNFERGDYRLALKGWTVLANRGDPEGQYFLGHMYAEGLGAPQDYARAAFWFSESASQGYSHGQFALGYLYEHGWGVSKDHSNALKWYKFAADQGLAMAHNNVGHMYEEARGVPQDYAEAHMRYSLAISLSNLNPGRAIRNLNNLIKKMTPAQTAQAKRLAREWRKEHLR